jgi:hypothetical protein
MKRTLVLTLAVLTLGLSLAAPAMADSTAEVGIEDTNIVLANANGDRAQVLNTWKNTLGIDVVRITAFWDGIAPSPTLTRAPVGFTGANQYDRRYRWAQLDSAVNAVRAAGLVPMITISQKGPVWASRYPFRHNGTYYPSPLLFGRFAYSVARRFSTRVFRYEIGNEPNQSTFLTPQNACRRIAGRRLCERVAPNVYRQLVNSAYPSIKRGDRSSQVVIGGLAPIGGTSFLAGSIAPIPFLRAMGCETFTNHPITTGLCRFFHAARGDAFSYHPYSILQKIPPFRSNPNRNLAGIYDIRRFLLHLDALSLRNRLLAPYSRFISLRHKYSLYLTEYGYETNPTDTRFGLPPATQNLYLQQASYLAWLTPRVKNLTQYLFRDDKDQIIRGSNIGFQTGLEFTGGAAKPALASFPNPFVVDTRFGTLRARVWGQIRPGGPTPPQTAFIEQKTGAGPFVRVAAIRTTTRGYFSQIRNVGHGNTFRFTWGGPAGTSNVSDERFVP